MNVLSIKASYNLDAKANPPVSLLKSLKSLSARLCFFSTQSFIHSHIHSTWIHAAPIAPWQSWQMHAWRIHIDQGDHLSTEKSTVKGKGSSSKGAGTTVHCPGPLYQVGFTQVILHLLPGHESISVANASTSHHKSSKSP